MIKLICGYKNDNNYDYTISFKNREEQEKYFNALECIEEEKYDNDNENGYVKQGESFAVSHNYDELVDKGVNYLIFNNGDKDIYCFITKKEYLSEDTTLLHYEVDVMQTYLFDFIIQESFIERKVCEINEISDYDEGLTIGEHEIVEEHIAFKKEGEYFAMFNGFKEQELIFEGDILKSVVDLAFSTSSPTTVIDDIQYPLYFMPLQDSDSYDKPLIENINVPGFGETVGGGISAKIFRFIKGHEGFAQYPRHFNNEDFNTGGYGITEKYQKKYFDLLGNAPISEQQASEVLSQMVNNEFAKDIYQEMLRRGLKGSDIRQRQLDAFISLGMNCGLGNLYKSTVFNKYCANVNDESIYTDWLGTYTTNEKLEIMPGLISRRKLEVKIFKDGIYEYNNISVYGMNGQIVSTIKENNGHGFIPSSVNGGC